mmetsp:Transcript_72004/g.141257  ORF Transcript_72004/g.141257 Transcript_72004/m.141257 type:complete len:366 (+) Transcript_72004:55-1152(+)
MPSTVFFPSAKPSSQRHRARFPLRLTVTVIVLCWCVVAVIYAQKSHHFEIPTSISAGSLKSPETVPNASIVASASSQRPTLCGGERCESLVDAAAGTPTNQSTKQNHHHHHRPRYQPNGQGSLFKTGGSGSDGLRGVPSLASNVDGDDGDDDDYDGGGSGATPGDHEKYARFDPSKWRNRPHALHVVFSTDCSSFQDWQSQVLLYSAEMARHEGPVTRIASGCDLAARETLRSLFHEKRVKKSWKDAWVHFTPRFSKDARTGHDYKFYNKPFGMAHWILHGDHGGKRLAPHPFNSTSSSSAQWSVLPCPAVIALIDPDNFFLRPLTTHLGTASNLLVTNPVKKADLLANWPTVQKKAKKKNTGGG